MEKRFTFECDIEYTMTVTARHTVDIFARSLADAKEQVEEECRHVEDRWRGIVDGGYDLQGATVESADVDVVSLADEDGNEYDSLAIEERDDQEFTEGEDEDE